MSEVILDASALLTFLNGEPGAERVEGAMAAGAALSSVNLAEVVAKLRERGMPLPEIGSAVSGLGLRVEPFGEALAYLSGDLRSVTKAQGLSLGDRACLALGVLEGLRVLTADRAWDALPEIPGLTIEQVR